MQTKVIGGDTPNQETAIGAGPNNRWRWWTVLAGLVACVAVFFGLAAAGYAVLGPHHWTETELNETFVSAPLEAVQRKFGTPDSSAPEVAGSPTQRLEYRGAVRVQEKPAGTLVTFHGEGGRCVRVTVE